LFVVGGSAIEDGGGSLDVDAAHEGRQNREDHGSEGDGDGDEVEGALHLTGRFDAGVVGEKGRKPGFQAVGRLGGHPLLLFLLFLVFGHMRLSFA